MDGADGLEFRRVSRGVGQKPCIEQRVVFALALILLVLTFTAVLADENAPLTAATYRDALSAIQEPQSSQFRPLTQAVAGGMLRSAGASR